MFQPANNVLGKFFLKDMDFGDDHVVSECL